ncbi:hypothetical protein PVAND_006871 [Polypedilum vanderplanki]|uniref:RRM domain-containing protein n=1 Tax=Polypedilum vanderplanki TaxID=319348 RepID=A0A9J6C523_POLVA|nr:hypothetical protein PVAND_006871 [Polypedilum vanderplanki]
MEQQQHQDMASGSPAEIKNDPGKMFIGGLSWQTSPESLRDYFSKFGEISEVMVMKDPTTRRPSSTGMGINDTTGPLFSRPRGFGFITFADPSSVDKVLSHGTHELDGKKIDPKVAFPRRAHPKMVTRTKKIFVGGLSAPTTLEDVKSYFEQFGTSKNSYQFLIHIYILRGAIMLPFMKANEIPSSIKGTIIGFLLTTTCEQLGPCRNRTE